MKPLDNRRFVIAVLTVACLLTVLVAGIRSSFSGAGDYDAWLDINDDGKIDMKDVGAVARAVFTNGSSMTKASVEYDSGWIDITDKCGQYFNITHDLNSSDPIVDITGKTATESGVHQRNLGGIVQAAGWSKTYKNGGYPGGWSTANSIVQTYDGGFVLTETTEGDPGFPFIIKTDFAGNQLWQRSFGAWGISSAIQSSDGGIVVAFVGSYAGGPICMVKFDSNGNGLWYWEYGAYGKDYDRPCCVIQTKDGGYAVAGQKERKSSPFDYDFYMLKTDSGGVQEWNRTYGSIADDIAYSVVQTSDGGYALAGVGFANLVITGQNGNYLRSANYGGSAYSMVETDDGKLTLAGSMVSGSSEPDFWLAKTDLEGTLLWSRTYGEYWSPNIDETAYSLACTNDGGFALAGTSSEHGNWFVKTDSTGEMQWNRTFGGDNVVARIRSIVQTADGGFAMTGDCNSDWGYDVWVLKTIAEPGLAWTDSTANTITLYRGATDPYWNFVRVRIWKPR